MNYYLEVLKKYAVFSGRASRAEYWYFMLFHIIISFVLIIIDESIGDTRILIRIYFLAIFIPHVAVIVRRLQDTNHNGLWFFVGFIPFIGIIILLVFMALDSQLGENKYGPNPKGVSAS